MDTPLTEGFTASTQDTIEVFERAESKLSPAFDTDDVGVGKLEFCIDLEFDPLLEVQQDKSELFGWIFESCTANHRMKQ